MPAYKKQLTDKQKRFADNYLETMNMGEAAIAAGYSGNINGARVWATRVIDKKHVRDYIDSKMESMAMGAKEVILRTDMIARGDIGDYINDDGHVDIAKAKREGRTGIVKTLEVIVQNGPRGKDGDPLWSTTKTKLELYPANDALKTLWKMYGLDKKTIDINIDVTKLSDDELEQLAYGEG